MKTIKYLLVVLFAAVTFEMANTTSAQASPTATFQRIVVRTGPVVRRGYYHRRPSYRRPVVVRRGYHRSAYRRQYRRY